MAKNSYYYDVVNKYYHNGDDGALGEWNDVAEDANLYFNRVKQTLTFNNFNYTGSADIGVTINSQCVTKIVLNGTNTITQTGTRPVSRAALDIKSGGAVTISGTGSLTRQAET